MILNDQRSSHEPLFYLVVPVCPSMATFEESAVVCSFRQLCKNLAAPDLNKGIRTSKEGSLSCWCTRCRLWQDKHSQYH